MSDGPRPNLRRSTWSHPRFGHVRHDLATVPLHDVVDDVAAIAPKSACENGAESAARALATTFGDGDVGPIHVEARPQFRFRICRIPQIGKRGRHDAHLREFFHTTSVNDAPVEERSVDRARSDRRVPRALRTVRYAAWARVRHMQRRFAGVVTGLALVVVSVVLAHELVYLARYGSRYNEALVHGGHGETWTIAVIASLVLSIALLIAAIGRLAWLGLLVRRTGTGTAAGASTTASAASRPGGASRPGADLDGRALLRGFLRIAPRLVVLAVVLLSLQENVERLRSGQGLPGPFLLLSAEYAGGLWITIAVGLAVALVAALFDWRRRTLLAQLRAARTATPRRTPAEPTRPAISVRPRASLLGRRSALRAPPLGAAS